MSMDIDEYSDRSIAIGRGLLTLCGDLYEATQEDFSLEEIQRLLLQGKDKVELFNSLVAETSGHKREEAKKSYGDYIESIYEYSQQLEEKINNFSR
ncbi:MAG TPA: hypothetical protein VN030_08370 [Cellvibrio sp.]|nr:hypothetical protein [Cellvibrio sp.]